MVDPSQDISIQATRSARKEKDMTVARIPRDPQNSQKFQNIVEQEKQKKGDETKKTQQQPATTVSIFDISSQQRKTRPLPSMASGKNAEATRSSVPTAKGRVEKKAGTEAEAKAGAVNDEKELKGKKDTKGKDTQGTRSALDKEGDEGNITRLTQGNIQEREDSPGSGAGKQDSSSSSKSSAMHDQLVAATTDLSATNRNVSVPAPTPSISPIESVASAGSGSTSAGRDMQQTIDAIVEAITLLQSGDQTDMKVLLSNPPILAGSEVVLTNYMGESRKFDVAFYNLTASSQQFLQQMQAEHGIRQALADSGYVLHMYAANVQPYEPIVSTVADNRADERRFHDEGQEGGEREQNQRET